MITLDTIVICVVSHGSFTAKNGTIGAKVIHLKSEMTKQPAALPSHFLFQKDERELRARDGYLDSLPYSPLRG